MALIYKTLFEVKLMHEYFLTKQDGSVVFEKSTQAERLEFLGGEFGSGKVSVNDLISFEFPEKLKAKYKGLFLKLLTTYSGCKVAVRVRARKLADQSTVYEPFANLPDDLSIFISIIKKNDGINIYTNDRIRRSCPAIYFFSNLDVITPKTFPYLTNNVAAENNTTIYEQGELALSSTNTLREFFRQGGTDNWSNVVGSGFANETDRLLLPEKFEYSFENSTSLTQATFVLKDSNGVEIASFSNQIKAGTGKTLLDFSGKVIPVPQDPPFFPTSFVYTLDVTGNNGSVGRHSMIFSDELAQTSTWAVLSINITSTNAAFNLFAPDGFLIRRKDAFGVFTSAPVFEIPVKSRFAYWRFINDKGKELKISPVLIDYVNKEGKVLVTKEPRPLAKHWFFLRRLSPPGTVYIPNPEGYDLRIEQDRRMFYNINVPQSVLFEPI